MKRFIYIPIAIIVLVAIFFLYQSFLKDKEWETYENTRYQFSLDYPNDWHLGEPETNNAGRIIISPNNKVECYAYGFANALTNEEGEPQSLSEFIDWLVDDGSTEVLEREKDELGGEEATYLLMEKENSLWDAIYTIDDENGTGFYCIYDDEGERENYNNIFTKMKQSLTFIEERTTFFGEDCAVLLNNTLDPLKDRKTFYDEEYTTVTITSRENWDSSRLPEDVLTLENESYTCYPMPYEYSDTKSGGAIHAQPEVTKVEWTCELYFDEWYYVSDKDSMLVDSYRSNGFTCEKQECFKEDGQTGFVWLCTK